MSDLFPPCRLVILGPVLKDAHNSQRQYRPKVLTVFQKHIAFGASLDHEMGFINSGRPYHLPLSFSQSEAEAFAADLTEIGCRVKIVASE